MGWARSIRKPRNSGDNVNASPNPPPPKLRGDQLTRLRHEAFEHLTKAREIYDRYRNHRGKGNVHVTCGYLNLDEVGSRRCCGRSRLPPGRQKQHSQGAHACCSRRQWNAQSSKNKSKKD
jgi:hypothetical protein